jgi:hypothetical protein
MPDRVARRVNTRAASEVASRLRCSSKDRRRARMLHHCRRSSSNLLHHKPSISRGLHHHTSMKRVTRTHRCRRLRWGCTRRSNNIPAASIPFLLRPRRSTITRNNSSNTVRRRPIRSSPPASRATHTTRIPCHRPLPVSTVARTPTRRSTRSPALLLAHPCSPTPVNLRSSKPSISALHPVLHMLCNTRLACPRSLLLTRCRRNLHTPPSRRKPMSRGHPSTIPQTSRSATEASVLVPRQRLCSRPARTVPILRGPLGRGTHHTSPVHLSAVRPTTPFHLSPPPSSLRRSVPPNIALAARRPAAVSGTS